MNETKSGQTDVGVDPTCGPRVAGQPPFETWSQPRVTEAAASTIVHGILDITGNDGGSGVAASVVDTTGELVAFLRNDGAPMRAIKLALMKAYTSARFGKTTLALQQVLEASGRPLSEYGDAMFTALAGGAPLVMGGETIGGVGVSGRLPTEDHALVVDAVERVLIGASGEYDHGLVDRPVRGGSR